MVNEAAGERAELGVRMLHDRRKDRRRPALAFGTEGVRAFVDAPAVVAAFLDLEHHVPEILAHFAGPEIAIGGVEAELPALANAVGIDLAAGTLGLHERVVAGNGVAHPRAYALRLAVTVHVDAEKFAGDHGEFLAVLEAVGDAAAVAGGKVEHAIRAEAEAAAVVAAARPRDDPLRGLRVGRHRRDIDGVAHHLAAIGRFLGTVEHFREVDETVGLELRMEREAINRVLHIEDEFFLGSGFVRVEDVNLPLALGDAPGSLARHRGDLERLVELQLGINARHDVRIGRLGRALHFRCCPEFALLDAGGFTNRLGLGFGGVERGQRRRDGDDQDRGREQVAHGDLRNWGE